MISIRLRFWRKRKRGCGSVFLFDIDFHLRAFKLLLVVMIICHCERVSDREIRRCIKAGACSTTEVTAACGAGGGCGGCHPEIENLIEEVTERRGSVLLPLLQTG